jgi:hypothetical protein
LLVEGPDHGKHDAITASGIRETRHGAGAAADFAKDPFNRVRIWYENGGAPPPVELFRE